MHPEKRGGQESLQDVRVRLLPGKRNALDRLIELDQRARGVGSELITRAEASTMGALKRELAAEVGGQDALDRLLGEAHGQAMVATERKRVARTQLFTED